MRSCAPCASSHKTSRPDATSTRFRRVESLFDAVLDHPTAERTLYLNRLCGRDAALRAELESLLRAHRNADSFIEAAARFPSAAQEHAASIEGRRIGAYRLVRQLGSGGMGTVYEAVQDQPQRTVALKLMNAGLGSISALRRFQYESQILGRLRHPGIAHIYEAGVHNDAGLSIPYFAMEYIPGGRTILEYAAGNALTVRERVQLFIKVCDAVNHAHQKGVLHRDLKPGNILVADENGSPKIIDFGVARALDPEFGHAQPRTRAGQLVGTLQYMSPEQCDADPQGLDTRSDVYSLGLVLYELLCGCPPYNLSNASISAASRTIRETQPRRPADLSRAVRGDLETVVLKVLEKDRERRYQSAADLGLDLRRWLKNQPVSARPASPVYQFRKMVARHKPMFAATLALLFSLTGFGIGMTLLYQRATGERLRAERAESSWQSQAQTARDVSNYLVSLFQTLDPWSGTGPEEGAGGLTVLELLDRESGALPKRLRHQPLTQAEVLMAVATVYQRMEMYGRAAAALQSALDLRRAVLGENHVAVAEVSERLGDTLRRKGEFDVAEPVLRRAVAIRRQNAADRPGQKAALSGPLSALANVLCSQGRLGEAETLLREALHTCIETRGQDDANVVLGMLSLANLRRLAGDGAGAESLCREALARCGRLLPEFSRKGASALSQLSAALRAQGRYEDAEAAARDAWTALREYHGGESYESAHLMSVVAALRRSRGDLDGAESLYRQALDWFRRHRGPDHPSVGSMLHNLLQLLAEKGDRAGLAAIHEEFVAQRQRSLTFPEDHPARSGSALHLGQLYLYEGDAASAEPLLRECVALRRTALSPGHWLTAYAECVLGECLIAQGRSQEAAGLVAHAAPLVRTQLGASDDRAMRAGRTLESVSYRR